MVPPADPSMMLMHIKPQLNPARELQNGPRAIAVQRKRHGFFIQEFNHRTQSHHIRDEEPRMYLEMGIGKLVILKMAKSRV